MFNLGLSIDRDTILFCLHFCGVISCHKYLARGPESSPVKLISSLSLLLLLNLIPAYCLSNNKSLLLNPSPGVHFWFTFVNSFQLKHQGASIKYTQSEKSGCFCVFSKQSVKRFIGIRAIYFMKLKCQHSITFLCSFDSGELLNLLRCEEECIIEVWFIVPVLKTLL